VILAANTSYAGNNILYQELKVLGERVAGICPFIK